MKQLIVLLNNSKIPSFNNVNVFTFEEEFEKYKRKCKKSAFRTEACFSWHFDSTLSDLKKSIFVYPLDINTEDQIKKHYKVIEENEVNN